MKYRELVEKFIETEEGYGNIFNREGVTVGLLRKFAVFLEGEVQRLTKRAADAPPEKPLRGMVWQSDEELPTGV